MTKIKWLLIRRFKGMITTLVIASKLENLFYIAKKKSQKITSAIEITIVIQFKGLHYVSL